MKEQSHKILVIDDDEMTRETVFDILNSEGHFVASAASCQEARENMDKYSFDLILSDLMLLDGTGMEIFEYARTHQPGTPFILITGHASVESAIEATRLGAYEYIQKPVELEKLRLLVRNALHLSSLEKKVGQKNALDAIKGQSTPILRMKELIQQVSRTDATVLIQGETGTGKELVANAVQALSERSMKPYVRVNIAALPKEILESELFGHEKGAFTGAVKSKLGRFELADDGTLFLDEIGELPIETQVKLLRVLQSGEFERVGGMENIRSDFRLIAATNANLKELVKENEFREDLYFRINVVNINVPPLRERTTDIPLLCDYFLSVFNGKYNRKRHFSKEAQKVLAKYSWPGNIRELENAVERAVVTSIAEEIKVDDLPDEVRGTADPLRTTDSGFPPGLSLDDIDKQYILTEYERLNGNKTQLAKSLGIGLKTLYRKFDSWGID